MGNIISNSDILDIIMKMSNNYNCTLVCKEFYEIIKRNSSICVQCNKFVKIFGITQWFTDEDDPCLDENNNQMCHGYYNRLDYFKYIKRMLTTNPVYLTYLDRQCVSLCLMAVRSDGKSLQYVKNQTDKLCLEAVKNGGCNLKYVKNQTDEIRLNAILNDPSSLQYISEEHQTEELCFLAVSKYGCSLKYVKNQTPLLCMESLTCNTSSFEYISEKCLTNDMCMLAVTRWGHNLKYVPQSYQTKQVCIAAINNTDGTALQYIKNQTLDICVLALQKQSSNFGYIKNPTEEHYVNLFKIDPHRFSQLMKSKSIIPPSSNNIMFGTTGDFVPSDGQIRIGSSQIHTSNFQGNK